jgi:glycosyltransferase involved in cell wall biosynthesis
MLRGSWVPPAAERPIRLRFEHTRFGHIGGRSGYPCFISHLDPQRFRTHRHAAADNHDEIARWLRPLKAWLRRHLERRPMKWYKLSDLNAELYALGPCLAGQVDLIHFLDGEHSGQFLPRLLRTLGSKVRTLATFHQPPDLLEELADPEVLPGFDHIVLVSPSQRPYFEGRVAADRLSVILHGVDTEFFHPAQEERLPGPLRCVTAGHWLRDWGVFRSVAQRVPSVEFHIVTARETGTEDVSNVIRHVGVDDATLASLYRSADILFLPLHDSTANNTLLEGIASGLPVITTDLSAVRAYLPGGEAILAPKGDADAALGALQQLRDDPALRRRMGAAARARAEALSWPRVASEYAALFARLVERASAEQ